MRALGFLAALPLLAALSGCSSISTAIPTTTPVLLGPLDRIGGRPLPEPKDEKEFEGEEESALMICMASGIPTVSATHPLKGIGVVDSLGGGLAAHAGEHRLRDVTPRLTRLGTGAWVMFFAGCYGQAWWTSTRGTSEVAR